MKATDYFLILNKNEMKLDHSVEDEYDRFSVPADARKLIDEHPDWPFSYHLTCEHNIMGLRVGIQPRSKRGFFESNG